ncbi:urease accessory protein UreG [Azospirillum baldaniorum]|uniref:urease accessory protein UreG n=1 Tax=Azospirillum baldaniorum TaxID=1064539 RepID=UPI00119D5149|nr:urease accessory protein UreG [Azospirillum baldaniorum]
MTRITAVSAVLLVTLAVVAGCRQVGSAGGIRQPYDGATPYRNVAVSSGRGSDPPAETTSRTTCPNDDVVGGGCLRFLHQQPREFWEQYQREAPALRERFLTCARLRDEFGDWVRLKRNELRQKDRQWNMETGYLPHSVVEESTHAIHQMATAFNNVEYHQIINAGARPDLCRERILFWKAQILAITEKFPPLRR